MFQILRCNSTRVFYHVLDAKVSTFICLMIQSPWKGTFASRCLTYGPSAASLSLSSPLRELLCFLTRICCGCGSPFIWKIHYSNHNNFFLRINRFWSTYLYLICFSANKTFTEGQLLWIHIAAFTITSSGRQLASLIRKINPD